MDIYDRSGWPPPDDNPLIALLGRGDEWYDNEEVVAALGLTAKRALLSQGTIFGKQIGDGDTALMARDWIVPGKQVSRANAGRTRVFSRRAVVLAAMRTNTVNAAAFRDWIATMVAREAGHGFA